MHLCTDQRPLSRVFFRASFIMSRLGNMNGFQPKKIARDCVRGSTRKGAEFVKVTRLRQTVPPKRIILSRRDSADAANSV